MENKDLFKPEGDNSKNIEHKKASIIKEEKATGLERITISSVSGPLVIFYGPRDIGKTVALLRLSDYIKEKYDVNPVEHFINGENYKRIIKEFNLIKTNLDYAPEATGNISFLLLNINRNSGSQFCQILEAPGEHFFDSEKPNKPYPRYFRQILNSERYRKVFVFFFTIEMFENEKDNSAYCNKIVGLINKDIDPKKDKIILVCNKADKQNWWKGKKPLKRTFKKQFFANKSFSPLKSILIENGFKRVPFVVFSAGDFNDVELEGGKKEKTFTLSQDYIAKQFWNEIYISIKGRGLWFNIF